MNQILYSKISDNSIKQRKSKVKKFKFQFFGSIVLFVVTVIIYSFNLQIRNNEEKASKQIANNYNILRLYNNSNNQSNVYNQNGQTFTILGMIEIPKISVFYPIISEANDDLLKISPCRISGPMPNEEGNLCIAGHNYDNYKFFSKVSDLQIDDEIIIHDLNGNKINYIVFKIYEVLANDLSPLSSSESAKKQVTLITCNNFNSSTRFIIKANAN